MATGTIEYAAPITGLRFKSIEISNPQPAVEKIVLETQDEERVRIVFHLVDIFSFEDAENICK